MRPLSESPFSYNFNVLLLLGSWFYEPRNSPKVKYYVIYRLVVSLFEIYGIYGLLVDLYLVLGDIKKITWNLCITSMFIGSVFKNFQVLQKYDIINKLRLGLHEDAESRQTPEDTEIHNAALGEIKFLQTSFYILAAVFIPVWLISRYVGYYWGDRKLPIPFHVPKVFDLEDDLQFHFVYLVLALSSVFVLRISIEGELSMFGLLIQISREYRILIKDIPKVSELYEGDDFESGGRKYGVRGNEVNPRLRKIKTKMLIKKLSARQKKLIEYIKIFETCFNQPLLQEFLGVSVTIVSVALQCLWESIDFFGYIIYQIGYLSITISNLFLISWLCTRIHLQSLQVGEAFYRTLWYKMETDLQKDIGMILMRCQNPPKLTMGKFIELSLSTFMGTMSHIYSWMTLFRQIEFSS